MTKEEKKEYAKKYNETNKEKIVAQRKAYRDANRDKIKAYNDANKDKNKTYKKINKEKIIEQKKEHYYNNKNNYILAAKKWKDKQPKQPKTKVIKTPEEIKRKQKEYYQKNKDKINTRNRMRKQNEPLVRLRTNIRSLIGQSIRNKGFKKSLKSEQILNCTFEEFKQHLEGLFEPWMNWDNYGNPKDGLFEPNKTWDIDHIIPVTTAITEEDIIKLNHYTNLKPLCSYVNRWVKKDS